MDVLVQLNGRDAIPVRAIPLLTDWEVMSPDEIAGAFSDDEDGWRAAFTGLRAFRLGEEGDPVSIAPRFWGNIVSRQLQGLSDKIEATEVTHEAGYIEWREAAIKALPPNAFVWRDEYEHAFEIAFGEDAFGGIPRREQWVSGEKVRERLTLDYSPTLVGPIEILILESLQAWKPRLPVVRLSREEWGKLGKGDMVKAWWEGREPSRDVTEEDLERAAFLDGFASVAYGRGLDASDWAKYPSVTAKDAAMLVCGINPHVHPDHEQDAPAGISLPTFRKVKSAFDSMAKDGQDRTLKDWAGVAAELCPQVEIDVRVVVALNAERENKDIRAKHDQVMAADEVRGITTPQVAAIFQGLPYSAENWPRRLSSTAWVREARLRPGERGGVAALWCPLTLAKKIHANDRDNKERTLRRLNDKFQRNPALEPWRDDWAEHFSMFRNDDVSP